ncbi:MAG: di-heme oxidoredictase family protein [Pseudomonadota bacterium]
MKTPLAIVCFTAGLLAAAVVFLASRSPSAAGKHAQPLSAPQVTADAELQETLPVPGASWTRRVQPSGSLIAPAQHLDADGRLKFVSGLSFFKAPWIEAPASTTARDGLGPLFNAHACISCHKNGSRSASPLDDPKSPAAIVRVRVPAAEGGWQPHPLYGSQLQTRSSFIDGAEAEVTASFSVVSMALPDGTVKTLRKPQLEVQMRQADAWQEGMTLSWRTAPALIGMGLLEAIPTERLLALADADDADGDGISGRIHWRDTTSGGRAPGRFGWKAKFPTVAEQTGSAFSEDMGITNPHFPTSTCTERQTRCLSQSSGNDPVEGLEITSDLFDYVVFMVRHIPPPAAGKLTPTVARGRTLFEDVGCAGCHTPSHETEAGTIWPYTDLLLHDLGAELAEAHSEGEADGREWRTPPLWGIGTQKTVAGHTTLLHDGRARNVTEAVLWHGGEAAQAADRFKELPAEDRAAVVKFVNAL